MDSQTRFSPLRIVILTIAFVATFTLGVLTGDVGNQYEEDVHDATSSIVPESPPREPAGRPAIDQAQQGAHTDGGGKSMGSGGTYARVRVYFGTNRNITNPKPSVLSFGSRRSNVTYGICEVSVPLDHTVGAMESPSWLRLEFREDPEKHIVLLKTEQGTADQFFATLKTEVAKFSGSRALLFVHGYNVSFEDAARRAAQMHYDLDFGGPTTFFSWPSRAKESAYTIDEANAEWTETHLRTFLVDFLRKTSAENVYLVAHSMGSRPLTRAFNTLVRDHPELISRVQEIILAAPDIDADVFKNEIAPVLVGSGERTTPVTLYASATDLALAASRVVHGSPRAGDTAKNLLLMAGIETLDASALDTSFLGHSYYGSSRSVLSDIHALITTRTRACLRFGMKAVPTEIGRHCVFRQ